MLYDKLDTIEIKRIEKELTSRLNKLLKNKKFLNLIEELKKGNYDDEILDRLEEFDSDLQIVPYETDAVYLLQGALEGYMYIDLSIPLIYSEYDY